MSIGLSRARAGLLVVDMQERLGAAMHPEVLPQVLRNTSILIESAARLGLPIVVTQQYPKGLGPTVPAIDDALRAAAGSTAVHRFDKTIFAASTCEEFVALAPTLKRDQWILTGMEAHVCVYQTARGILDRGHQAHVVADASCSRSKANWRIGMGLCERAGALITSTEVCVFDLLARAGTDDFKALSRLIK
ncbi:MAG TPA: isochorismatase family protein [Kofleriaceae bacterium]|nr:isochorismatase family protein [Kofleriaceae bacterium]